MLQVLTLLRIPLAVIFAVALNNFETITFVKAVMCLLLIGLIELSDLLDGYLARKMGIVTEWGAMLDPYADSISRLIIYWGFASSGLVLLVVPLVMAFRDITVAYCRITLTRFNHTVSAKLSGKIKAIVQGCGSVFIVLSPLYKGYTGSWPNTLVSWIIIIVTLASIVEYAHSAALVTKDQFNEENFK